MVACAAEEPEQENQLRKPRCCSNFAAEDSLALFVRDAENHTAVAPMSGLSSGKRDSLEQASDVCVVPDAGAASTAPSAAIASKHEAVYTVSDENIDGPLAALPMATATQEVKDRALRMVFIAMFLHVFAWAITIPPLSPLLTDLTGSSTSAARWLSGLNFAWSVVELIGTLVLGALSDR